VTGDHLRQAAEALNEAIANRLERRRPPSLENVLRAARSGDEDAFGELWHHLQPELLRFFTTLAPDATEELAAETWVQVVRGVGQFESDEPAFQAWVFTIAHTNVVDWWQRSSNTARPVSSRSAMALVAALPTDQAEVIVLRVVAGLEVDQVAAITGKRPGTIRVLTHKGLRRLAGALRSEDPSDRPRVLQPSRRSWSGSGPPSTPTAAPPAPSTRPGP